MPPSWLDSIPSADVRRRACLAYEIRGTTAERRELYDVRRDPAEQHDRSRSRRELVGEMEKALDSYQRQPAAAARQHLEPALLQRLRSLGYSP